ncbi:hypothetical protein DFH09DRAFT_1311680 [Mycena vulgaris]|nr:hypothetical protein DFH09DRAFT_1311680 [Mycena vulgaris]
MGRLPRMHDAARTGTSANARDVMRARLAACAVLAAPPAVCMETPSVLRSYTRAGLVNGRRLIAHVRDVSVVICAIAGGATDTAAAIRFKWSACNFHHWWR